MKKLTYLLRSWTFEHFFHQNSKIILVISTYLTGHSFKEVQSNSCLLELAPNVKIMDEFEEVIDNVYVKNFLNNDVIDKKILDTFQKPSIDVAVDFEENGHNSRRSELQNVSSETDRDGQ